MKYLNIMFLIGGLFYCRAVNALEIDNETDFLAKEARKALEIVKYKKEKERKEQEEREAIELDNKQKVEEQQLLQKQLQQSAKKKAEEERREKLKIQQEEQSKLDLARKQALEYEERHKRVRYKIVRVFEDIDRVELHLNKGKYYAENYSDFGIEEIKPSAPVNRDNIISNDVYVRLLIATSISSRRAGSFVGMVEKNVYSADSNKILIPKGSNFICNFEPLAKFGETSINATCTEINLPNGVKMRINAPVYDQMGRIGIVGELDNKSWEKYGQTFMFSLLGGLASHLASNSNTTNDAKNFANYTTLNMVHLSTQLLKNTMDLVPVVTVPSGTRVLVRIPTTINFANN